MKLPYLVLMFSLLVQTLGAQPVEKGEELAVIGYSDQAQVQLRARLRKFFDAQLEDPKAYRALALTECKNFPEGRVYPFVFPALGYANLALRGDLPKVEAAERMRKLIDLAIPEVAGVVGSPGGDLLKLTDYRKHGTFLGTLNFALGNYALVSDDGRYAKLHAHLSKLLLAAMEQAPGAPIDSYPEYTWYIDTIMALASLHLAPTAATRTRANELLKLHLAWRDKSILLPTGLPRATTGQASRGCDLSLQICLLANMDPAETKKLYANYVKHHWVDRGMLCGFGEWPKGHKGPKGGDIDSGPVLMGIGASASGIGLGSSLAVGDISTHHRLMGALTILNTSMRFMASPNMKKDPELEAAFGKMAPLSSEYVTGFLYGDAVLFYALTWTAYPENLR